MPEGHTVHRTANAFWDAFRGTEVTVDSPQGRFAAGAVLVSGATLAKARAIGKQLFLDFSSGDSETLTIRIHLGIYGKWTWRSFASVDEMREFLREPAVGEVRARFYGSAVRGGAVLAELRGPTVCELLAPAEVAAVARRLGPDPLNPDARGIEFLRFRDRVQGSTKSIGLLLMDQSVISGIGNVYRAELLFRAGIDPYTPGNRLSVEQIHSLWKDAVALLKVGVKTGYMITRNELFTKNPDKTTRNFVYKRENQPCRVCANSVSIAIEGGRKLYWCANCQR